MKVYLLCYKNVFIIYKIILKHKPHTLIDMLCTAMILKLLNVNVVCTIGYCVSN